MPEIKKTNCHFCGYLCGFNATVEEGRVIALEPDPTRYPYDTQTLAGCQRWRMNLDVLDGIDRVNYPIKRIGERGSGTWKRISWDQALDEIASKLNELRSQYNSGVVASMIGGPHTSFWPLHRFMSLFGSPNNAGIGQICWNPRIWCDVLTFGWTIEPDITTDTKTLIVWGTNPAESDNSAFWRSLNRMAKEGNTHVVVIDPRFTRTARIADTWLPIAPGSDCLLGLAMLHVIIEEGLYDAAFVERWCFGFDELATHVQSYSPENVAEQCGISASQIRDVARSFAQAPSAIISGRGIDQIGANVLPTHRVRCALLAICGYIDRPGGASLLETSTFVSELSLESTLQNFETLSDLTLNTGYTPLQNYGEGYSHVQALMSAAGKELPARYLTSVHPHLLLEAMEGNGKYPVRAAIVEATNPLVTYADTHRVLKALQGLDLLVVLDYYITPTAAIADYVLPSAGAMERPTFQAHGGVANFVYGGAAACAPYYERKTDYDIFRELGIRCGQADGWPHETFEDACAYTLAPTGMSWDVYCEVGAYATTPEYFKHERVGVDGKPQGFATSTGMIELVSPYLESIGGTRLPIPGGNYPLCSENFIKQRKQDGFTHLTLLTGSRKQPYNASMYLNHPPFRARYPFPEAEMSEATAERLGAQTGDIVTLATDQGETRMRVAIIPMVDNAIHADYGWWHPELPVHAPDFGGIFESNINTLTRCSLENAEPMIGTWAYNNLDCMVKVTNDEPLTWTALTTKIDLADRINS